MKTGASGPIDSRYLLASRRRGGDHRQLANRATEPAVVDGRRVDLPILAGVPAYARDVYPAYFERLPNITDLRSAFAEWGEYGHLCLARFDRMMDLPRLMGAVDGLDNFGVFALRDDEARLENLHFIYPSQGGRETKLLMFSVSAADNLMPENLVEIWPEAPEISQLDRTLYVDLAVLIHSIRAYLNDGEGKLEETVVEVNLGIVSLGRLRDVQPELIDDGYQETLFLQAQTLLRTTIENIPLDHLGFVSQAGIFRGGSADLASFYGLRIEADLAARILVAYAEKVERTFAELAKARSEH